MWLINGLWRHWGLKWTMTHTSTESMEMTEVCVDSHSLKNVFYSWLMWTAFEMWWHARRKQDFVFRQNGRVHLNRRGRQFSRLLAVEVCASAVLMLDTPCSEVVWRVLATHSIRQFPLHFPSRASPCAITFQLDSTNLLNFESLTSLSTVGSGEYEFNENWNIIHRPELIFKVHVYHAENTA